MATELTGGKFLHRAEESAGVIIPPDVALHQQYRMDFSSLMNLFQDITTQV